MPTSDDDNEPGKAWASCAICGQWPPALREAMRSAIDELPLRKAVCDKCVRAFWVTLRVKRLGVADKGSR